MQKLRQRKGYLPDCLNTPSLDSKSVGQRSKSFTDVPWVIWRPKTCLGRGGWCVGAWGSSGGDWADLDIVNGIRACPSGR